MTIWRLQLHDRSRESEWFDTEEQARARMAEIRASATWSPAMIVYPMEVQ